MVSAPLSGWRSERVKKSKNRSNYATTRHRRKYRGPMRASEAARSHFTGTALISPEVAETSPSHGRGSRSLPSVIAAVHTQLARERRQNSTVTESLRALFSSLTLFLPNQSQCAPSKAHYLDFRFQRSIHDLLNIPMLSREKNSCLVSRFDETLRMSKILETCCPLKAMSFENTLQASTRFGSFPQRQH